MFFVTLFNQFYWVLGATLGAIFGSFIKFNTDGLDFVMTALFVVIFIEQWMKEEKHISSLVGLGASIVCLIVFGGNNFIIPAMIAILGLLTLSKKSLEKVEVEAK
jgi:4-azaleucine resistance transporter AzlC